MILALALAGCAAKVQPQPVTALTVEESEAALRRDLEPGKWTGLPHLSLPSDPCDLEETARERFNCVGWKMRMGEYPPPGAAWRKQ